ncbi:MAG: J domain-containing protein [Eubacteriales bacterium]|nr:J domain-containing protein [Eubacteriales bacterium]
MHDPYKVLGITRDASDDEVKKAYRSMSRKYHPDANINNPHKEQAEEMFKIVQQAYKQIMDEREGKTTGGYGTNGSPFGNAGDPFGDFGSFGGYGSYGRYGSSGRKASAYEENPKLQAAANYINSRHFKEAMHVLEDIPDRNGTWYYLHAIANYGQGRNVEALDDAEKAVQMEPDNQEFRILREQLNGGWYGTMGRGYGYSGTPCETGGGRSCASECMSMLCCCSCLGGGFPICCCI